MLIVAYFLGHPVNSTDSGYYHKGYNGLDEIREKPIDICRFIAFLVFSISCELSSTYRTVTQQHAIHELARRSTDTRIFILRSTARVLQTQVPLAQAADVPI